MPDASTECSSVSEVPMRSPCPECEQRPRERKQKRKSVCHGVYMCVVCVCVRVCACMYLCVCLRRGCVCVACVCECGYHRNSDTRLQNTQYTGTLHMKVQNLLRQIPMTWTTQRCLDVF